VRTSSLTREHRRTGQVFKSVSYSPRWCLSVNRSVQHCWLKYSVWAVGLGGWSGWMSDCVQRI
jgi:hypothetical protein